MVNIAIGVGVIWTHSTKYIENLITKNAEPGGSLDAENVCGADAVSSLAAQVTLIVMFKGIKKHMKKYLIILSSLFIASCGSTGVIQMEANKYMVSVKNAKVGFVTAAEEKAEAYQEANAFCAKQSKSVETINLEMRNSGALQSASATLEFKCVDSK